MGFATICLSTSIQSSQALHERRQRLTVSLLFGSTPNAEESFSRGCFAAYVDLCKVFDSVNADALWRILLRGVPPKLINLMYELYSGTESAVRCGGTISAYFQLLLEFVRGVYWPPHFSELVWTEFWGGRQRDQAAVHRLGMSRSLTLILQMMQSSLRRL